MASLWIDLVQPGGPVTFQYGFERLAGDRTATHAFDNKAGLLIIAETLQLLREEGAPHPEVAVYAIGTAEEEIDSRCVKAAVSHIDPREPATLGIGKRPGMSNGGNTRPVVFRILRQAAGRDAIPHEVSATAGSLAPSIAP